MAVANGRLRMQTPPARGVNGMHALASEFPILGERGRGQLPSVRRYFQPFCSSGVGSRTLQLLRWLG